MRKAHHQKSRPRSSDLRQNHFIVVSFAAIVVLSVASVLKTFKMIARLPDLPLESRDIALEFVAAYNDSRNGSSQIESASVHLARPNEITAMKEPSKNSTPKYTTPALETGPKLNNSIYEEATAVVWITRYVDDCAADRLRHLIKTAGSTDNMGRRRDFWVLHHHDSFPANDARVVNSKRLLHSLGSLGLRVASQGNKPIDPFDCSNEAGSSKSSFLRLLVKYSYSYGWHLEDDTFYTGPWNDIFDLPAYGDADVVAKYEQRRHDWFKVEPCQIRVGEEDRTCEDIHPYQVLWLLLRASLPFAKALLSNVESGIASGHHEWIAAAACRAWNFRLETIPFEKLGTFQPGHWGEWMDTNLHKLARLEPMPHHLYHPVKCSAHSTPEELMYLREHLFTF
uniref:Uncharacterized protein n=1 Tax=Pseudictyota dubia TaxID=2749911 RepID=A0A7R9W373_9STRA|mmetsp:Transcript_31190/g.57634  ORF Transcript_31190/g.57634 Transcript_31190/m.57634 type:complete len:396 (+) Transcript_31190:78-1265(+)